MPLTVLSWDSSAAGEWVEFKAEPATVWYYNYNIRPSSRWRLCLAPPSSLVFCCLGRRDSLGGSSPSSPYNSSRTTQYASSSASPDPPPCFPPYTVPPLAACVEYKILLLANKGAKGSTHKHTTGPLSRANSRFNILPKDTLAFRWGRLGIELPTFMLEKDRCTP
ncbi:unnamed protein product [Pleuronectes platessa]|uniref:Uncharacterized protein n=1 Tax=Pleuronectes platessa TaxID=8262 RepID=A0A9N7USX9_PLEPL|nr:unnamed protein product [Pleuronectes platessa]